MQTITANEAKARFDELIDRVQREPVRVTRRNRVVGVMVLVCLGKTGPILERADCGERIGESYGTSTFYAGTDHREAA
jgi:prevent-host-death family protein